MCLRCFLYICYLSCMKRDVIPSKYLILHFPSQVAMFMCVYLICGFKIQSGRERQPHALFVAVYVGEDQSEEPDFTYIPETHQIASSSSSANTLESSLMLLQESLESGAALAQFEVLHLLQDNIYSALVTDFTQMKAISSFQCYCVINFVLIQNIETIFVSTSVKMIYSL